ncbi:hypothetical protein AVEN_118325-1 [Araneus ventricosus]|uniref:Uncharacterized protein n=1 Tax=Araneus ventricosus TaxID=182803 RepID=A0A4Y2B4W3_ARAVE|nr:hypothetical protein AVEN_118325-1 [Araneus ventricosus]
MMPQRSICRVLSRGCIYKAKRRSGSSRITNKRDDRQIKILASTQEMTVPENQSSSGLTCESKHCLAEIPTKGHLEAQQMAEDYTPMFLFCYTPMLMSGDHW